MLFEIINPSDKMTIEADDAIVASVAALYLGQGKIGLEGEDGQTVFPVLLYGGDEYLNKWLADAGIGTVEDLKPWAVAHKDEIAVCLESIVYGSMVDRKAIMATLEGKPHVEVLQAMAIWNDRKRSSLNDYSEAAFVLAKHVREMTLEEEETAAG